MGTRIECYKEPDFSKPYYTVLLYADWPAFTSEISLMTGEEFRNLYSALDIVGVSVDECLYDFITDDWKESDREWIEEFCDWFGLKTSCNAEEVIQDLERLYRVYYISDNDGVLIKGKSGV